MQFDVNTQFCITSSYYYSTDLIKVTRLDSCNAGSYYIRGMYCLSVGFWQEVIVCL